MKKFGIDISGWQGNFDFDKAVAEGVKFAIIKGGGADDGYYIDSRFETNYKEAKSHNLPVGAYWFSRALSVTQAKYEAEYFYNNILKGKQFELPVYIDVENKTQLSVGKRNLTDIIKTFCDTLENKGYYVGIYTSLSTFSDYMYDSELTKYAHWVAQWSTYCSYKNISCLGMWQFGGETNFIKSNKVAGQVCDQNYMLIDYPSIIKKAGLNGFSKSNTTGNVQNNTNSIKKDINAIVVEVLNGDWGNGNERKNKLAKAGYDYNAVQKKVNEAIAGKTIKKDSIVRVNTGAKTYDGKNFASWVYNSNFCVMELCGSRAVIGIDGRVTAAINIKDLTVV